MQYIKRSPPKMRKTSFVSRWNKKPGRMFINLGMWKKGFSWNRYTVSNSIGIVGLSCFYAINMSMDKMMFRVMKVAIQTWILIVELSTKNFWFIALTKIRITIFWIKIKECFISIALFSLLMKHKTGIKWVHLKRNAWMDMQTKTSFCESSSN